MLLRLAVYYHINEGGSIRLFFKYLKGAGSSLFVAILIFILMFGIHPNNYVKISVLFIALYNYFFCILGLISSLILPPVYFILITGSIVFYLAQLIRDKKWSVTLSLSGPLLILMIWLAF